MQSEDEKTDKINNIIKSKLALIQINDSSTTNNLKQNQDNNMQIENISDPRDLQMSIYSQDNQSNDNSNKDVDSEKSSSQLKKKIHKSDEKKEQKRGRKPKQKMKQIIYGYKQANNSELSDAQSQLQFETNIMKLIPCQKVFFLAGDILTELDGATNQMGIDLFNEQRNTIFMEKIEHGVQIEIETYKPLKNFESVIYQMESCQDQKQYEFSQYLKGHQQLVYLVSSQMQDLQNTYKFNQEELDFLIYERKKIKKQQRKQLLEQLIHQDSFGIIATVSLSFSNQTTTISSACITKSMMALIGYVEEENVCDMFKLGFLNLFGQASRRKVMRCNIQAQQDQKTNFKLEIDDFELTTFDDIKITCKNTFEAKQVEYPDHLKFKQHPLLNSVEKFYVIQYDITPQHLEQLIKLRQEYILKAPQNESFPNNYNYNNFFEYEVFEYSIHSQIFLEKFYEKQLENINQAKKIKYQEQQQQATQFIFNNQTCGFRYI